MSVRERGGARGGRQEELRRTGALFREGDEPAFFPQDLCHRLECAFPRLFFLLAAADPPSETIVGDPALNVFERFLDVGFQFPGERGVARELLGEGFVGCQEEGAERREWERWQRRFERGSRRGGFERGEPKVRVEPVEGLRELVVRGSFVLLGSSWKQGKAEGRLT
jgi:hypothetical protein